MTSEKRTRNVYAVCVVIGIVFGAAIGFWTGYKVSEILCHDKKVERFKGK